MFDYIKVDDLVTCIVGKGDLRLQVTGLTPFTIVCGDWVFDRECGSCITTESPFFLGECFLQKP